jgi:hypothetical protein
LTADDATRGLDVGVQVQIAPQLLELGEDALERVCLGHVDHQYFDQGAIKILDEQFPHLDDPGTLGGLAKDRADPRALRERKLEARVVLLQAFLVLALLAAASLRPHFGTLDDVRV